MKKYGVTFIVYSSMTIEVEANSEEEACELAEKKAYEPSLCHQCSDELEVDSVGDIVQVIEIEKGA